MTEVGRLTPGSGVPRRWRIAFTGKAATPANPSMETTMRNDTHRSATNNEGFRVSTSARLIAIVTAESRATAGLLLHTSNDNTSASRSLPGSYKRCSYAHVLSSTTAVHGYMPSSNSMQDWSSVCHAAHEVTGNDRGPACAKRN